jgi:hypothetical protein
MLGPQGNHGHARGFSDRLGILGETVMLETDLAHRVENTGTADAKWLTVSQACINCFRENGDETIPGWAKSGSSSMNAFAGDLWAELRVASPSSRKLHT